MVHDPDHQAQYIVPRKLTVQHIEKGTLDVLNNTLDSNARFWKMSEGSSIGIRKMVSPLGLAYNITIRLILRTYIAPYVHPLALMHLLPPSTAGGYVYERSALRRIYRRYLQAQLGLCLRAHRAAAYI